ncbi:DUF21 domain-containing protein, partial [Sphingobacteriales bacterium CHB3]|nr:DUF21 domain-containing protein [Sphingobacteriales bacterium CHB3]
MARFCPFGNHPSFWLITAGLYHIPKIPVVDVLWLEIVGILILVSFVGFFSASEVAVLATRKSRMQELAEEGNRKAAAVLAFQTNPEQFLATIHAGVIFSMTLAAGVGGRLVGGRLLVGGRGRAARLAVAGGRRAARLAVAGRRRAARLAVAGRRRAARLAVA